MANRSNNGSEHGFTYLGLLIAIAIMGIGLLAVSEVWSTTAERQKMTQLDWVGQQYVQAIGSYYYSNTGSVNYYPTSLDDLLEDKRYLGIRRHIRRNYTNPFTGKTDWKVLSAPEGGINGVAYEQTESGRTVKRVFVFSPKSRQD
ncbi:MAG: type II secretion system protein [Aquabacterium sp.]|nr:type II secretion system protein [Aquabacterium sp.]